MKTLTLSCILFLLLNLSAAPALAAGSQDAMSRDLLEVTVPPLEQMYRDHKYTVTQVVQWYIARIAKYNGIYRAAQNVDAAGALAAAGREDAEPTPPAATSSVVAVFPSRGLVSIAGIAPLDWLLDNTGPIARDVTDAAIALDVMAGEESLAQPGPYTAYLKPDALKGKRFGVPAFILEGAGIPFQGIPASEPANMAAEDRVAAAIPLRPGQTEPCMESLSR